MQAAGGLERVAWLGRCLVFRIRITVAHRSVAGDCIGVGGADVARLATLVSSFLLQCYSLMIRRPPRPRPRHRPQITHSPGSSSVDVQRATALDLARDQAPIKPELRGQAGDRKRRVGHRVLNTRLVRDQKGNRSLGDTHIKAPAAASEIRSAWPFPRAPVFRKPAYRVKHEAR